MKYQYFFVVCGDLFEFKDFVKTQEWTEDCEFHSNGAFRYSKSLYMYCNHAEKLKGTINPKLIFYGNYMNHDYDTIYAEYQLRSGDKRNVEDYITDTLRSRGL